MHNFFCKCRIHKWFEASFIKRGELPEVNDHARDTWIQQWTTAVKKLALAFDFADREACKVAKQGFISLAEDSSLAVPVFKHVRPLVCAPIDRIGVNFIVLSCDITISMFPLCVAKSGLH